MSGTPNTSNNKDPAGGNPAATTMTITYTAYTAATAATTTLLAVAVSGGTIVVSIISPHKYK